MGAQVLLVEGIADTTFYVAFCRETGMRSVVVIPPTSVGAKVNSKTNAIHILPILLEQLNDGAISNLGIVVDADYHNVHGLGFAGTLEKIREQLVAHGFSPESRFPQGGFLFNHSDGLAAVGAWIMPDNKREGMLEDFIKESITDNIQHSLHLHACKIVGQLPSPLFKPFHRAKADVATWLSWQKIPGAKLESTVGDGLIDLSSPNCKALSRWMQAVFAWR